MLLIIRKPNKIIVLDFKKRYQVIQSIHISFNNISCKLQLITIYQLQIEI